MLQRCCRGLVVVLVVGVHAFLLAAHLCNDGDTKSCNAGVMPQYGVIPALQHLQVQHQPDWVVMLGSLAERKLKCRLAPATSKVNTKSTSGRAACHPRRWAVDLFYFLFLCSFLYSTCCGLHWSSCGWRAFQHERVH